MLGYLKCMSQLETTCTFSKADLYLPLLFTTIMPGKAGGSEAVGDVNLSSISAV